MAKRKPKVDNRPWVNKEDIVVYDGTKESVDKIHLKAKKLGGAVGEVKYSPALKRLRGFKLYVDFDDDVYYIVLNKSVVVFTDTVIRWFESEEKALAAVRVRTGFTRVTIRFEQDDEIKEIVVPKTMSPVLRMLGESYDYNDGIRFRSCSSEDMRMTIDLGQMFPASDGATHYTIDRVVAPDYVVPEFDDGKVYEP